MTAFSIANTSASSAKQDGTAMEFVKSMYSQVYQKSPNTQMKELIGELDSTDLNTSIIPQSKHKLALTPVGHAAR